MWAISLRVSETLRGLLMASKQSPLVMNSRNVSWRVLDIYLRRPLELRPDHILTLILTFSPNPFYSSLKSPLFTYSALDPSQDEV